MFLVAIDTTDLLMEPLERKIRLIMPEGGRIQARDIGPASLMLGMAIRALSGLDGRDPAMKPLT